jgi:hypothetical protein
MGDQHSALRVKLADIVEGLEFLTDEGTSYLNTTTGEVVYVTTEELRAAEEDAPLEDFPAWQHDAIRIAGEIRVVPQYDRTKFHSPAHTPMASSSKCVLRLRKPWTKIL